MIALNVPNFDKLFSMREKISRFRIVEIDWKLTAITAKYPHCVPTLSIQVCQINPDYLSVALNQPASIMYHDMGYPSHSYANYLAQYESNAYGDSAHYAHHLSAVPVPPPPPPYANESPMHHQHLAMMQPQENRTWYQPPIAVTPQSDHR